MRGAPWPPRSGRVPRDRGRGARAPRIASTEHGFQLAELRGLKAASRLQPRSKPANSHGLIVSSTSICATTVLRIASTRRCVWALSGRRLARASAAARELVQELLEPQLVHLVDPDEEQLVVLLRTRVLRREQLLQVQVGRVVERGGGPGAHVHSVRPSPFTFGPMLRATRAAARQGSTRHAARPPPRASQRVFRGRGGRAPALPPARPCRRDDDQPPWGSLWQGLLGHHEPVLASGQRSRRERRSWCSPSSCAGTACRRSRPRASYGRRTSATA